MSAANKQFGRLYFLAGLTILFGLFLLTKLFFVQIVSGEEYRLTAESQYQKSVSRPFNRGSIFFETKDGTLVSGATLEETYTLVINPSQIVDSAKVYQSLNEILPLDQEIFLSKISSGGVYQQIATRLTTAEAAAVQDLNLVGASSLKEYKRAYPGGTLAAHVLGFMGFRDDEYAGRYGLERQYEDVLRRDRPPSFSTFVSSIFSGAKTDTGNNSSTLNQGDIVTNIEPNVQGFLENQLKTISEKWQTKITGGIILDPKTGAVLALAAEPSFNPGQKQTELFNLPNPLVENVYEMGSIIKPLTVAAGIDAGVINEATTYEDLGRLTIDGRTISNYDGRARGQVPVQEIINQSLNTGAVFIMQQLGRQRFRDYFLSFGLGQMTGIDLPGEVGGLVKNLNSHQEIEYATAAFGQGIAVSPINITVALSALANNGLLVTPQVVKRVEYGTGLSKNLPGAIGRRVLQSETAARVTAILVRAVDEVLAGGAARSPHYQIAAKTGTAQIANSASGGYEEDKYLHSFFGYFPATAPRFSVFLYALEPVGAPYASQTLTAPFTNLSDFLLNYYQVPPDR